MTRFLFASLMVLLLVAPVDTTTYAAAGKSDKSEKSEKSKKSSKGSVGTKELLARIEALEEVVLMLIDPSPDVSGSTYRTYTIGNGFAAFNNFAGKFHLVSFNDRLLTFNEDGTGYWSVENCSQQQLTEIGNNAPSIAPPGSGCGIWIQGAFTYVQSGNDVEITGDGATSSLLFTVSNSGDAITAAGGNLFGDTTTQFMLANNSIMMGVRVGNQSF